MKTYENIEYWINFINNICIKPFLFFFIIEKLNLLQI